MYIQIRLILKRYNIYNFLHISKNIEYIEYMHSILNINIKDLNAFAIIRLIN